MTRFLDKSFSTYATPGQSYRDNWDAVFGKRECMKCEKQEAEAHPLGSCDCCAPTEKAEPPKEPDPCKTCNCNSWQAIRCQLKKDGLLSTSDPGPSQ